MHPRSPKLLEDIRDAAAFIREVVQGKSIDDRQIIAFRNILIHGYDLVDHALVWSTIETQVPALLRDVEGLLTRKS
jgi:uncharacterized protein with HEPN domain